MKLPPKNSVLEFFGYPTFEKLQQDHPLSKLLEENELNPYKNIKCSFSIEEKNCMKIRKAYPNALIGNCSVVKTNNSRNQYENWIVCPYRFEENMIIFKDAEHLLKQKNNALIVREIEIQGGRIDFGIVNYENTQTSEFNDFLAIEIQSMGTSNTGPIWTARNDFLRGNLKDNYSFSLNQKDASKKILIQLLHKGFALGSFNYKLVLVVQDHFLTHLREQYDIANNFHVQDINDPIHIHSYKLIEYNGRYTIQLSEKISTTFIGLNQSISGNANIIPLTINQLRLTINRRPKFKFIY